MNNNRLHWKEDPEYIRFDKEILNEKLFTFEEILDISTFKNIEFKELIDWNKIKNKWCKLVDEWNKIENISNDTDDVKALGFVGFTYLMVVFPYKKLSSASIFCQHEVNMFNRAYFYAKNGKYLPFKNVEEL